ncbi:hypothetical protein ABVK25_004262 [Lepraria finkii]|uniref:Uncharacterized protein n=1 Tax=Lepraria finkii TaxID=1340010 RepID=A0ABR4BC86_9LECA
MILRLFESLSVASPGAHGSQLERWLYHMSWARRNLQQRATVAELTPLEKGLLRSSQGALLVKALNAVEPCIFDSLLWKDILIECYPGVNHDFLKDQYGLWPRLVRLPLLIYDVIEYNRPSGADDQTNRTLRQRAHKLHWNLDLSSLKRSSLESLQLEFHDPNAGSIARTYSVIAATNYACILTATSILIDRLVKFRDKKYYLATGELLWPDGQLSTEESALRYLLGASYAWWKARSPAFAHSKHADIMWSASFKTVVQ